MKSKWGKRIGYGIGDLGCNLVFSTMSSYLLIFYTDVFGIAAAAAGTMMLVTKLIDAITDTIMGMIVDKTHTKWGQGRPYFVVGAVPFAVFTVLTFIVPDLSEDGKLVWAYVTYCLLCTAYTVVNIPLNTIVPRLSADPNERNILVTTRMVCALLGTAIVMSIAIYLVGNALILINQTSVAFQLTGLVITGLGIYGIFGTVFAMQPDAIDYSEWKKNRSISGTIAAFQGLFVKASMGIIGLYLGMNGYDGAASTQGLAAQQSIQFCYMWIPVILCVLLAVTNVFWKLDSCADEMRSELDARRKKLQELVDKW